MHRVVRATAAGVIGTQDLIDLDRELVAFLALEEAADRPLIRALFDFTEATAVAVPETVAAQRSIRPAVVRGQRVMVPSRTAACSLVQSLVHGQRMAGDNQMAVAESLDEAHALLGMDAQHYEDIR